MATPKPPVVLRSKGDAPKISVVIAKFQGGTYTIRLKPKKGQPKTWDGMSDDKVSDTHVLGPVKDMNNALLSWRVLSSASDDTPGQLFSVTVLITQDGAPVENGLYQYPNPSVFDIVRLSVA